MGKGKQMIKQKEFEPHPEEIRIAKREILDLALLELQKVANYWNFRYRDLVTTGVGLSADTKFDIGEDEDGLVLVLLIQVYIPEELWVKLAKLKKRRQFKFPKPHPTIRQRYREMEEKASEIIETLEKELSEGSEEIETGDTGGEND